MVSAKPTNRQVKANKGNQKAKVANSVRKVRSIESEATGSLYERDEMLHILALCLIAKHNALFLGVPGTAKTLAIRAMAKSFCQQDKDCFATLVSKTTKPDELFGPVDINALNKGEQRRLIDGFAPTAKVCVFDEMWKGSSAILNTLLTIANEREFRNGSDGWVQCPVRFSVGMSNEFPEEPALLAALFDRFPIKLMVGYIEDDNNFKSMLSSNGVVLKTKLLDADLAELDQLVSACEVPDHILDAVCNIRADLKSRNVIISDRRWKQAVQVMKAEAVYHGRTKVAESDLKVLEWIAWNQDGEQSVIKSILPQYSAPVEREIRGLLEEVYAERKKVMEAWNGDGKDSSRKTEDAVAVASVGMAAHSKVSKVSDALMAMTADVEDDTTLERIETAIDEVDEITRRIRAVALGTKDVGSKSKAVAELAATEK